jgi:hypothetical protein
LRKNLQLSKSETKFEELFDKIVFLHLPLCFIESFSIHEKNGERLLPKNVNNIYTASTSTTFNIWAAKMVNKKSSFNYLQHGGGFGMTECFSLEYYQRKVSNKFFTWGWQKNKKKDVISPCNILIGRNYFNKSNENSKVLWVGHSLPRYSYKISCEPSGALFLDFINDQIKIGKSLSKKNLLKIKYREYPNKDYDWGQVKRLKDKIPNLKISNPDTPFVHELINSSLCLCFSNSTAFLESINSGTPTLLYLNSKHWSFFKNSLFYYKRF